MIGIILRLRIASPAMRRTAFVLTLFLPLMVLAQSGEKNNSSEAAARKPFVGTWRLVSSTEVLPDGTQRPYGFGAHPDGILMYDAHGYMCAQVVNTDRPKWKDPDHPTPEEVKTAFDGFGGYCGTYTVDPKNSTLAHIPKVPFAPDLVDQPKPRTYKFEKGKLVYTGTEPFEGGGETHWTMTWERVK